MAGAAWVTLPLVLPLVAAVLGCLFRRRTARLMGLVAAWGIVVSAVGLAAQVFAQGPQLHQLGGWGAPPGIDLYADGLSALMLLMTALVGAGTSVYAVKYLSGDSGPTGQRAGDSGDRSGSFWVLWMFLWASLNGLFLSTDAFNLYVNLEILGLAAMALVTLERGRTAVAAGLRYLLVSLLGSLAYLFGVGLLYGAFGALGLEPLSELVVPGAASCAALGLFAGLEFSPLEWARLIAIEEWAGQEP